jgi:hypothetical protein
VVRAWLADSAIRDRARLVTLGEHKDPSALHLADPDLFTERLEEALRASLSWGELARADADEAARAAWEACAELAGAPDILARFREAQEHRGVAGEARAMQLTFLALTSRFLNRPVSIAVKGTRRRAASRTPPTGPSTSSRPRPTTPSRP